VLQWSVEPFLPSNDSFIHNNDKARGKTSLTLHFYENYLNKGLKFPTISHMRAFYIAERETQRETYDLLSTAAFLIQFVLKFRRDAFSSLGQK